MAPVYLSIASTCAVFNLTGMERTELMDLSGECIYVTPSWECQIPAEVGRSDSVFYGIAHSSEGSIQPIEDSMSSEDFEELCWSCEKSILAEIFNAIAVDGDPEMMAFYFRPHIKVGSEPFIRLITAAQYIPSRPDTIEVAILDVEEVDPPEVKKRIATTRPSKHRIVATWPPKSAEAIESTPNE